MCYLFLLVGVFIFNNTALDIHIILWIKDGLIYCLSSVWMFFGCFLVYFLHLHISCFGSLPLKTCPWAPEGWTKVDLPLNLPTVTTCPLRAWSAVALQLPTYPTRWMGRCLVSGPPPPPLKSLVLVFPSPFSFSFFPLSPCLTWVA